MRGDNRGKYTDIGERYFEEFNTLFWLRPGNKRCLISLFTFIYYQPFYNRSSQQTKCDSGLISYTDSDFSISDLLKE